MHPDETQNLRATPKAMPRDAELGQMLESTAKEAQDRIGHHRAELAMWERIQASAHAGLSQLHEASDQPMQAEDPYEKGRY